MTPSPRPYTKQNTNNPKPPKKTPPMLGCEERKESRGWRSWWMSAALQTPARWSCDENYIVLCNLYIGLIPNLPCKRNASWEMHDHVSDGPNLEAGRAGGRSDDPLILRLTRRQPSETFGRVRILQRRITPSIGRNGVSGNVPCCASPGFWSS